MFFKFPLVKYKSQCYICLAHKNDFLAQLVEHLTLNQRVWGSSPQGITIYNINPVRDFFVSRVSKNLYNRFFCPIEK